MNKKILILLTLLIIIAGFIFALSYEDIKIPLDETEINKINEIKNNQSVFTDEEIKQSN